MIQKDVICVVNVQHDCSSSECHETTLVRTRQERTESDHMSQLIVHKDTKRFVLNTNSLHNYQAIALTLPADLPPSRPKVETLDIANLRRQAARSVRDRKGCNEDRKP